MQVKTSLQVLALQRETDKVVILSFWVHLTKCVLIDDITLYFCSFILTAQICVLKVMIKRQRTAFPPNFVHSLDGSHMMMTAIACKKEGLNFAGTLVLFFGILELR